MARKKLKKVRLAQDVTIMGAGVVTKGTELEVVRQNSRYVYVMWHNCELCLSCKDVEKVR